jgi:hypothetical protein
MGSFEGTVDFDPDSGVDTRTSTGYYGDWFVSRFDSMATYQWARNWSSDSKEFTEIATDYSGNLFLTGDFNDTFDFDPGSGEANFTSAGDIDSFLFKLNQTGNYQWGLIYGSTGEDESTSVTTDINDNIYTAGYYSLSVDFDPGTGIDIHNGDASDDACVVKYKPDGTW